MKWSNYKKVIFLDLKKSCKINQILQFHGHFIKKKKTEYIYILINYHQVNGPLNIAGDKLEFSKDENH